LSAELRTTEGRRGTGRIGTRAAEDGDGVTKQSQGNGPATGEQPSRETPGEGENGPA
jgi:hypothetical protein